MHQVLFSPFGFAIHTYSVVLIISFAMSIMLAVRLCKRRGPTNSEYVQEVATWGIIWGIVGCRIGWILWEFPYYYAHPLEMFNLRAGGLTILGGIIMPALVMMPGFRRKGVSVLNVMDSFAAPLLLGMAVGRIGCFFNGCCFGKVCDLPIGVTYPAGVLGAGVPLGPRHPAQFYELFADLLLMAFVIWLLPRIRFAGQAAWTMLCGYGVIRFLNELVRDDGLALGPLSLAQWVGVAMFVVGLLGVLGVYGKRPVDISWQLGGREATVV